MSNKIYFQYKKDKGPIQVDEVSKKKTLRFYCEEPFSILFENQGVTDYLDEDPSLGVDAPRPGVIPVTFDSKQTGGQEDYRIKIKFKDLPQGGFDYTVRIRGEDLDPRVVPPR